MTHPRLTPYLTVRDAVRAIEFYGEAFGAAETGPRLTAPGGKILHTELRIGDARFMLADEYPGFGNEGPESLGGTSVRLALSVDDVDAFAARAVEAGAELLMPVADQFYGERSGRLADPFGHLWIVSTPIEKVPPEEMQRRADELFGGAGA